MKPTEKAIAHSRFKFEVNDESLRITRGYPLLTTLLAGAVLAYLGLGFGQAGCRGWLELRGGEIPTSDALINIGIGFGPVLIIALVVLQAIWPPIAVEINS